ncbi:PEP-CTERM sorting domain-containing protein [Puniceibacterium sediminis]|uniref:PEP-CTERM protein-sorting domain-containing protein n=1 Tax=Puniceibacterium sediminis TaxID=1608407 RepID=A0A238W2I4_9RHOB|nr:PEP-CTERM sorting domain-containing protein [Puniceibacterium sediminis]SNR40611.1 PEP-CTERM protein-sorting domain-containing protein [Puniceibacterium sediminis]
MKLRILLRAVIAFMAIPAFSLSVAASTVNETSVSGGDFSGLYNDATVVGFGSDTIAGTWYGSNDYDFLAFTGLAEGSQTVTLTFSPIGTQDYSYSAGGHVFWQTTAFDWAWQGTSLGQIQFGHYNQSTPQTLTLSLGESFDGTLYLALLGTNSGILQYAISAPGNALVSLPVSGGGGLASAVPLPSSVLGLLAGLAALVGFRARRRRQIA